MLVTIISPWHLSERRSGALFSSASPQRETRPTLSLYTNWQLLIYVYPTFFAITILLGHPSKPTICVRSPARPTSCCHRKRRETRQPSRRVQTRYADRPRLLFSDSSKSSREEDRPTDRPAGDRGICKCQTQSRRRATQFASAQFKAIKADLDGLDSWRHFLFHPLPLPSFLFPST